MDRKYLTPPFDMSEYIHGTRFVVGGRDFEREDQEEERKKQEELLKTEALTPKEKR